MAYPAGNVYAWNGVVLHTRMPASGETVNGQPFPVPGGCKVMTIYMPAMTGSATVKIQSLAPTETVEATQVWADVYAFDVAAGATNTALDAIPESKHTTIPISATGGGFLRLVASADQSAAVVTIPICLSRDG